MGLPAGQAESARGLAFAILVVEDEPLVRPSIAEHLRSVGYLVIEAGTADEAVLLLSSGTRIHLVFCDVELRGTMGGFSLAVWIRDRFRSIPVILTSGVGSVIPPLSRQHLVPLLEKPYRPEEAADMIARALASSSFARRPEIGEPES